MNYNDIVLHINKNRIRRKPRLSVMGKLFIVILLTVIFEGALRKWVSSALTNPIIIFRDAMALYGVFSAINSGSLNFSKSGAKLLRAWTVAFMAWGLFQIIFNGSSPLIFIIGTRFWLLYLWFGYAAAVSITEHDFNSIAKIIIIILIIMTPLAIIQHFLPPSSFWNKQVDGDEGKIFLATTDIVRTTGTFSFTAGYTVFLSLQTPFVLAIFAPQYKLWKRKWVANIFLIAIGICTIVSGSRSSIIFLALLFSVYVISSIVFLKGSKKTYAIIGFLIMTMSFVAVILLFSRAVVATQDRFESAAESENFISRIVTLAFGENGIYENLSLIGHGFGSGSNFVGVLANTEYGDFLLAETESGRTILEGGLFGLVFAALKIFIIVIGLRKSLLILKSSGNFLPILLWITTSVALTTWQISGQLTINAFGGLLIGLAFSSLKLNSIKSHIF